MASSKIIQRLDQRMAKFITNSPLPTLSKSSRSYVELPSVKLQPLCRNQGTAIKQHLSVSASLSDVRLMSKPSILSTTKSSSTLALCSQADLREDATQQRPNRNKTSQGHWRQLAMKTQAVLPNLFEVRSLKLKSCIRRLRRAVAVIANNWSRSKALVNAQTALRGCRDRLQWRAVSKAVLRIQTKWRGHLASRRLTQVRKSAALLTAFWR
jgi:hypothetical protein